MPSKRKEEARTLKSQIYEIQKESKRSYGAPKIQKVLEQKGKKSESKAHTTLYEGAGNQSNKECLFECKEYKLNVLNLSTIENEFIVPSII